MRTRPILTIIIVIAALSVAANPVLISEFMAKNSSTIKDSDGDRSDWIELYNAGETAVNLAGWHLTDNAGTFTKWTFPATNLAPGAYLLVFASDKNRAIAGQELHANFKLSASGEYLGLIKPDGVSVAFAYAPAFPEQYADVSYGISGTAGVQMRAPLDAGMDTNTIGYLYAPTPGAPNTAVMTNLGATIKSVGHAPLTPAATDSIVVTARISGLQSPVAVAALRYRVMYGAEVSMPMYDDGLHGDGEANDGWYGATIPSGIATPGQMIRYRIIATNSVGIGARWPLFLNPTNSPEYLGMVVDDPTISTNIPVYHWFVQNTGAADRRTGTRCSLYYDGEFYDNIFCRLRGGSSSSQTKKPHKIEFNDGYDFKFAPGEKRVDEINLSAAFDDPTYMRDFLSWETFKNAGLPYCYSYQLQLRQNGSFHSLAVLIEQVDKHFLRRHGYDDKGVLYKAGGNGLFLREAATLYEKKTPRDGDHSDLQGLINMLTSRDAVAKRRFAYDKLNLPEIINFLAANIVLQDWDYGNKNYYVYRDRYGSDEWTIFGWDKNLTFGYVWDNSNCVANDDFIGHSGGFGVCSPYWNSWNALYGLIFNINTPYVSIPDFLPLYARRARTLMDKLLQPPDTPVNELKFEQRIEQLRQQLKAVAQADRAKWGWPAQGGFFRHAHLQIDEGCTELTNLYLARRRTHLFVTHNVRRGGILPDTQPASANLLFGTIESVPASGNKQESYIELRNTNSYAIDISGWRLSNDVVYTFQPGVVVAAGGSLYVSPRVSAFRARSVSPRSNEYRFVQGNYAGRLSSWGGTIDLLDDAEALKNSIAYPATLSPPQQSLRVTEIMYHPADPPSDSPYVNSDFEFIELYNIGAPLNVSGVYFEAGITFSFGTSAVTIPSDTCAVIVKNLDAFATRYDTNNMLIVGEFAGKLDNAGERLALNDPRNEPIQDFSYSPTWYPATDGHGSSLELIDPHGPLSGWGTAEAWRASVQSGGTPGYLVPEPAMLALVAALLAGFGYGRRT